MDKTIKLVKKSDAEQQDFEYWLSKNPSERMDSLQYLRNLVYELKNEDRKGFQRVFRIVKRK